VSEYKKKLIEVALPLEAINRESAREKSIRHGHPSTLHLWWARRPLAACRAVLFAQLVDDPSAHPDMFPTQEAQAVERQRLFDIIERLVVWENINDEALLREANEEILKSTDGNPPAILDPFAGGGSIPLEAQRLGLEAHASDLNPVAVLINKALIEVPPKWAGRPPVFPGAAEARMTWPKATGLAEDVRRYGEWVRDEAEKRIGNLYPKAVLTDGTQANVIAWIWARTVTCPNPACGLQMPLVRSWWLSKKKGQETFIVPSVVRDQVMFDIGTDPKLAPKPESDGTVSRNGARCFACDTAVTKTYIQDEGKARRMSASLMAVVAEGGRRRHYLPPSSDQVSAAQVSRPNDVPDVELPHDPRNVWTPNDGLTTLDSLFTNRQLKTLATLSDLVGMARDRVLVDARAAGIPDDSCGLEQRGCGASAYADSVALYLGLGLGRSTDINNALCRWENTKTQVRNLFSRQAIPMVWDFAEAPPLSLSVAGSYVTSLNNLVKALERTPAEVGAEVTQANAATRDYSRFLVSTDPPYYDNIGYANLSDFFYGWLRRSLHSVFPNLLSTLQTPKAYELVADPYRQGGKQQASEFFEHGFTSVFSRIRLTTQDAFPITVFYAFKQSENDDTETVSTGWQTLLEGMLGNGWEVTATWPMRTELANKVSGRGSNMLASSIVLALRPRGDSAETVSRRGFVQALQLELPQALRELQQGSIAPVDLAQAAIGPGMSIFSRYSRVLEADGSDMTVRTALALINQALDEVLAEQEGDFDAETRFAVKWFSQFGWNEAPSGEADVLTRAVNTTVTMLERGGIFRAAAGRARLLEPSEMSVGWNPADDKDISVWEVALRLGRSLMTDGLDHTAVLMRDSASRVDLDAVKELAYLMYSVCERKGWAESAMLFNALGTSWGDVSGASRVAVPVAPSQGALEFGDDDE
jgi:putative DNA methylase